MASVLWQPGPLRNVGDFLIARLEERRWTSLRAAVAFVKRSGVEHLADPLAAFGRRATIEFFVGVDLRGTSIEGLRDLATAVGPHGVVHVVHDEGPRTFHPKVFLFANDEVAQLVVGSANLTDGGLFANFEAAVALDLDLGRPSDRAVFEDVSAALDDLFDPGNGTCLELTEHLFGELVREGYIVPEAVSRGDRGPRRTEAPAARLFGTRPPVNRPRNRNGVSRPARREPPTPEPTAAGVRGFVMTLQRTDVGVGQVTAGTSRRSPEIFIPVRARKAEPWFWGWPEDFTGEPATRMVRVRLGVDVLDASIMCWPRRYEFRLRHEKLRSAGAIDDILKVELAEATSGYDYAVEIVMKGSALYSTFEALCTHEAQRPSRKRWGYF